MRTRRLTLGVAAMLSACAPLAPQHADPPQPANVTIYILLQDWHTEIAFPAPQLTGPITRFHAIFPGAAYLTFGFGERLYYQKRHTDLADMLNAILPGPGILLTTALPGPPSAVYHDQEMITLTITQAELDRLADFVWDALEKSPDGALNRIGDSPYPGYVFYGSATTYSGLYTCNTWTLEALDTAGLQTGAAGVLFAYQAMDRVRAAAERRGRSGE